MKTKSATKRFKNPYDFILIVKTAADELIGYLMPGASVPVSLEYVREKMAIEPPLETPANIYVV